ncbi:hypothetical protein D3C81_1281390 [compost metagenome]
MCGNRLNLRHNEVRLLGADKRLECLRVEHIDNMRAMGHAHRRCILITIHSYGLYAKALSFDNDFLTQFAAAQEQQLTALG